MPLWLLILGGVAVYLWAKNQAPTKEPLLPAPAIPPAPTTVPPAAPSSSLSDNIPTTQSAVPQPMQIGRSVSLPAGTTLYSDSKLTNATGTVVTSGTTSLTVTVTATSVAADGSISASYTDAAGNTFWFAQPGT
jgi:hypothetical protein